MMPGALSTLSTVLADNMDEMFQIMSKTKATVGPISEPFAGRQIWTAPSSDSEHHLAHLPTRRSRLASRSRPQTRETPPFLRIPTGFISNLTGKPRNTRKLTTRYACVDALLEGVQPLEVTLIHGLWRPAEDEHSQTSSCRREG